jgi:SAM-dependent methyltransferase
MKINAYQKLAFYYDGIYNSKFYRQYAFFIMKIVKRNRIVNPTVLDCACGTGKLIAELTKKGIPKNNISGFDDSREMIKIAKINNPDIKFYIEDFKNFSANRINGRNIITCTFDAINYILKKEDLAKFFKSINSELESGGIFVFDFNTVHKKVRKEVAKDGDIKYSSRIKDDFWHLDIEIKENGKTYKEKHKERLYSFREMKELLIKAGFRKIEVYKDFNTKLKRAGKEQRLIIMASK